MVCGDVAGVGVGGNKGSIIGQAGEQRVWSGGGARNVDDDQLPLRHKSEDSASHRRNRGRVVLDVWYGWVRRLVGPFGELS